MPFPYIYAGRSLLFNYMPIFSTVFHMSAKVGHSSESPFTALLKLCKEGYDTKRNLTDTILET